MAKEPDCTMAGVMSWGVPWCDRGGGRRAVNPEPHEVLSNVCGLVERPPPPGGGYETCTDNVGCIVLRLLTSLVLCVTCRRAFTQVSSRGGGGASQSGLPAPPRPAPRAPRSTDRHTSPQPLCPPTAPPPPPPETARLAMLVPSDGAPMAGLCALPWGRGPLVHPRPLLVLLGGFRFT